MRIVVSGGGTAGHVSPVLATVDALAQHDKHLDVLFIGQRGGMEADLVRAANLSFTGIVGGKYRRIPGSHLWQKLLDVPTLVLNLRDIVRIGIGALQSWRILRKFKPDVIYNKGGPVGLPVGIAAKWLRIPMVIHEPDVIPGLGNKILGRWATAIAVGFPADVYTALPQDKLTFTGNPVQPAMLTGSRRSARATYGFNEHKPLMLVVGGSLGAMNLNSALLEHLPEILKTTQVLHITGTFDFLRISNATQKLRTGYRCEEFLPVEQMAMAYAAADVVVARAGASTIAELAALHKPTILVPNREAAAHQIMNAAVLGEAKAAVVSTEDPVELYNAVETVMSSAVTRKHLADAIQAFNTPDAAQRIATLLVAAAGAKG